MEEHRHVVWITKCRHTVLRGSVAERVRDIVREECRRQLVDILQGPLSADHVPVMLSIPPQVTISRLVQQLKGKSSYIPVARVSVDPQTLLGTACVGTWLLLPKPWPGDRRGDQSVHRQPMS